MSEKFTRRGAALGRAGIVTWVFSVPVLSIAGIWWHTAWWLIPTGLVVLWLYATMYVYDPRYERRYDLGPGQYSEHPPTGSKVTAADDPQDSIWITDGDHPIMSEHTGRSVPGGTGKPDTSETHRMAGRMINNSGAVTFCGCGLAFFAPYPDTRGKFESADERHHARVTADLKWQQHVSGRARG